jgi:hypothetical protein
MAVRVHLRRLQSPANPETQGNVCLTTAEGHRQRLKRPGHGRGGRCFSIRYPRSDHSANHPADKFKLPISNSWLFQEAPKVN